MTPLTYSSSNIKSLGSEALAAAAQAMRAVCNINPAPAKDRDDVRYLYHDMRGLEEALDAVIEGVTGDSWRLVNSRRALVTGPGGIGKSHLFGDAVDHQITDGHPSLLILGGTLVDDDPLGADRQTARPNAFHREIPWRSRCHGAGCEDPGHDFHRRH